MKIALPTHDNNVDSHFGHCEGFTVFTVDENNLVVNREIVRPGGGCGCKSNAMEILADMAVSVMLAGNMGMGAVNKLHSVGIRVYRGCQGDVLEVTNAFLEGAVTDSGVGCAGGHGRGGACHGH